MKTSIVSEKGWVVIPRDIRQRYGLTKGSRVVIVEYGGVIVIVPASKDPVSQGAGMLESDRLLVKDLLRSRSEDASNEK